MKKIATLLLLTLSLFVLSCEGDPGPPGQDGLNADVYAAQTYEIEGLDFQYYNDTGLQEALIVLPYALLDSDAVLVYRMEGIVDINGQPTRTWSPLPQNFFLNDTETIQYIFNHSYTDVQFLIDGNFDLSTLSSVYTQNQIFRIVILPADYVNLVNPSNLENVMELARINENDFEKL